MRALRDQRVKAFVETRNVGKPEWGTKRICQSCGAKFYDLKRDPIVCPKCEAVFDPEALTKRSRARPVPVKPKPAPKAVVADEIDADEFETDDDIELEDDADGDGLIEDTSDLEDDDNIVEVARDDEKDT